MKAYELGTIIIGGIFLSWMAYGAIFENNVEQPNYKLVSKDKGFEIRIYRQLSVISTSYKNQNSAFRSLFRMIDGSNSQNQKIPMTAPVIQDQQNMMFVMPENLEKIPTPNNSDIKIHSFETMKVAVRSFNGSAKNVAKEYEKLKELLNQRSIQFSDNWYLCQYNSPWVFPLFRKNEIWIELI